MSQAQVAARLMRVHTVVALALPAVEAFDLAIPAQVFGDRGLGTRYSFTLFADDELRHGFAERIGFDERT
jgi:hypothetical protein